MKVMPGETLAILGRSGTGKSVLLKTIIALLDPDQGEVHVFGSNLHALSEHARLKARQGIGYVFQGAALFDSLTVLENVGFPLYQRRLPVDEIRRQVLDRLTMVGLEESIDKVPSELSGGMQKRVGLARAIVGEPRLILYDEPTTGLDPLTTDVINRIILRLRRKLGVTSVVVTHDMRTAFTVADRIVMLDQGRIVAEGTPDQIGRSDNSWVQQFITGRISDTDPNVSRSGISAVLPAAGKPKPTPDAGSAHEPGK
jgi:phospholipid/cholesterol/gamma-HCH transport system ATP-binding protein